MSLMSLMLKISISSEYLVTWSIGLPAYGTKGVGLFGTDRRPRAGLA